MTQSISISKLVPNTGQIEGLPKNPRFIRDERFKLLVKSLREDPEMMELRELIVYPVNGKFVVIGGNMRLRAGIEIGLTEMPCKVLPKETTVEKLRAYTVKDNVPFGEWQSDLLANEWIDHELESWGVSIPDVPLTENEPEMKFFSIKIELSSKEEKDDVKEVLRKAGYNVK